MASRRPLGSCPTTVPVPDDGTYVCALSQDHEGAHYLIRPVGPGRVTPVPPDPDRDARRARYAQRERERVTRALAEWFRVALLMQLTVWDLVNKAALLDRLVGDILDAAHYEQWQASHEESKLQQKSHYGVPRVCKCDDDGCGGTCAASRKGCEIHGDRCAGDPVHHSADYVAPPRMAMDGPDE